MSPKKPVGPIARRRVRIVGVVGRLKVEGWYPGYLKNIKMFRWSLLTDGRWVVVRDRHEGIGMPTKPDDASVQRAREAPRKPSQVLAKFRELAAFMTDTTYPDKTPIGDVQLTLRTRGGAIVAQIKLAGNGGLRLTVEDVCVDEALLALEAALTGSPVPWETDPYPLNGPGKKKK